MKTKTHLSKILLLAMCMVISILPMSALADYSDVQGHWAKSEIMDWSKLGIIQGSDGAFRPNDQITRGEMAVIIDRIMKYQTKSINSFSDLGQSFYTDAILKTNAAGVILGNGVKVRPKDSITREEAVVMLGRALGLNESATYNSAFFDASSISAWAAGYVSAMSKAGFVHGSNGYFKPKDNITRAEVVKILDNSIKALFNSAEEYTGNISGTTVVNTANVVLKDMEIKGDLIIAEGVGNGDVTLDNVKVLGNTIVRGGGENSIHIKGNSHISNIIIQKTDDGSVRIITSDGAVVETVYVDDGNDDVILTGNFENVTVSASVTIKLVDTKIEKLDVTEKNAILDVDKNTEVAEFKVSENADGALITVYGKVGSLSTDAKATINNKGTITKAEINFDDIIIDGNKPLTINVANTVTIKPKNSQGEIVSNGSIGSSCGWTSPATVAVGGISINKTTTVLLLETTETLIATVDPVGATNKTVTWTSDNDAVVTVADGVVTPVAKGKATITATTVDGGKTATTEVIVSSGKVVNTIKDYDGYDTIQAALNAADGDDVIIVADGEFTEDLTIDKSIILKSLDPEISKDNTKIIGHHTITADNVTIDGFTFTTQETATVGDYNLNAKEKTGVTINNSVFDGRQESPSLDYIVNAIYAGKDMTIDNTTIKNGYYVAINGYPNNLTVKNSTITNVKSGINVMGGDNLVVENTNIDVVVQALENSTYAVRYASSGSGGKGMSITGGTLTVDQNEIDYNVEEHSAIIVRAGAGEGTYSISGVTINGSVWDASSNLDLDVVLENNFFPEGYVFIDNDKIMKPAARIGAEYYGTLASALNGAIDNDTVTLLKDVTIESADFMNENKYAVMISGKKLTLDLNGKTLSADAEATVYIGLTGELTLKDTSTGGKVINTNYEAVSNYGSFTMENGELSSANGYALYNYYYDGNMFGTATIKGGKLVGGDIGIANSGILEISGSIITGTNYDIDNSGNLTFTGDMTINKMLLKDGSDALDVVCKGTMTIASDVTLSGLNENSMIVKEESATIVIDGISNFTNLTGLEFSWDGSNWVTSEVETLVVTTVANLQDVLANEDVTDITIYGTLGSESDYTIYNVNRTVTTQGTEGTKVYGSFIVKADNVTIDRLEID